MARSKFPVTPNIVVAALEIAAHNAARKTPVHETYPITYNALFASILADVQHSQMYTPAQDDDLRESTRNIMACAPGPCALIETWLNVHPSQAAVFARFAATAGNWAQGEAVSIPWADVRYTVPPAIREAVDMLWIRCNEW